MSVAFGDRQTSSVAFSLQRAMTLTDVRGEVAADDHLAYLPLQDGQGQIFKPVMEDVVKPATF